MKIFKRADLRGVVDASAEFPALIVTGARQVGKTTLLKEAAEAGRHFVSLDALTVRDLAQRISGACGDKEEHQSRSFGHQGIQEGCRSWFPHCPWCGNLPFGNSIAVNGRRICSASRCYLMVSS